MFYSTFRPASWLFFRACVTLRQILALRKPRPVKRARKAAALCCVSVSLLSLGDARAEVVVQAPTGQADHVLERMRPLRQVGTAIAPPPGELPQNVALTRFGNVPLVRASDIGGRGWVDMTYLWLAPSLSYRPLYFEEANLERFGHSGGCILQPALSGAHFLVTIPTLPAQMVLHRPWERVYPLGQFRPGSPAAWERPW
jgi:hypothetical protein